MRFFAFLPWLSVAVLGAPACESVTNGLGAPLDLAPATVTQLQLAVFLENLEVAFFRSAEANLTAQDAQYGDSFNLTVRDAALQEVAHQSALTNILNDGRAVVPPPCQYIFPSTNTTQFLALGRTLSLVGVGANVALAGRLALIDVELASGMASIATTEARHSAFFEVAAGAVPNPGPFDTPIPSTWALNLALGLVVPGSCPVLPPVPILPKLTARPGQAAPGTQITLTWDPAQAPFHVADLKPLHVAWVNQMRPPVYTPLEVANPGTGVANVPEGLEGAVVAAVTSQSRLERLDELAAATLAGPALLLIGTR